MAARVGFLSVAHMHAAGYAHALTENREAELTGVWDDNSSRGSKFAERFDAPFCERPDELLDRVDAVIITSENRRHAEMAEWAAAKGKPILCEKPLVTSEEEGDRMLRAVREAGVSLMTAFPCRYSPAFLRLKERVENGEIGKVLSVCGANRGICPFGWFVETEKSGGGAMMDHTVHVADLLRALLDSEPVEVYAQTGNNIYGEEWDDTAMLHVRFGNGVFTTIDASWSRPKSYKTWGDVRMNVVGEKGVIEVDLFSTGLEHYRVDEPRYALVGTSADPDAELVDDFLRSITEGAEPPITFHDGLQAAKVAIAGYRSAECGQPVRVHG